MASDWFFREIPAGVRVLIGIVTKTKTRIFVASMAILFGVYGVYWWSKKKPKIKVYHTQTPRAARIEWIVEELRAGNDFHFVPFNPLTVTENRLEWFDSPTNSQSTVPVVVDNNRQMLVETASVCLYLVQLSQKLLPDKSEMPVFYDWIVYTVVTLDPILSVLEINMQSGVRRDEEAMSAAFDKADRFARFFNQYLVDKNSEYIFESRFTAADVVVGYCLLWMSTIERVRNFSDYPQLREYLTRLKARKAFQKAMGTTGE